MNILAALVLGLLAGWLIEWVIDWFYWRGRMRAAIAESKQPDDEQNMSLVKANKDLVDENTIFKERLAALQAELDKTAAAKALANLIDAKGNDNLQAIKGIGPAFSKRLKEAGMHTFDQLSRLTPQDMEKILGTLFKRFFSKENIILTQAKEFAEIKAKFGQKKA